MRRTVALAKVLTSTLLDDTDHHRDIDHRGVTDVRHRAAAALDALGVALTATGPLTVNPQHEPPNPQHAPRRPQHGAREAQHGVGTLVVANHVSWLDIPALLTLEPVRFLAKREVAGWPFVGGQARRMGTLLLDRWSLRGLPASVGAVAERLRAGETVVVFPEATTWCSAPGGPFRRAVFQAALDAGAPVRPVTLTYRQRGEPSTIAAFVGDDGLAASLVRVVRARELEVDVDVHDALGPTGDRRTLAHRAQHAVQGDAASRPAATTHADHGAAHV
ncbi:lysophospholipid acyltransferase family protein [Prauserella aidingensis]|uniref:lysophospholipid acyltransferase family protein n=1 Tax=Prauserella aidingensis TaxID=387890 RepID=UPI0020A4FC56|nr:lysophospholipid acyltransferase family protein [Prauserella aidingensis]